MAWYLRLWYWVWPFGRKKRERQQQINKKFEEELAKAHERHGDLDDILRKIREQKSGRTSKPPQPALQGNRTP